MTPAQIVAQALQEPRGTFKVVAALGELLAASSMFDLWIYQCTKGTLSVEPELVERAARRCGELSTRLTLAWTQFMGTTANSEDHLTASAELIPIVLGAARELRAFVGEIDFYDEAALSSVM